MMLTSAFFVLSLQILLVAFLGQAYSCKALGTTTTTCRTTHGVSPLRPLVVRHASSEQNNEDDEEDSTSDDGGHTQEPEKHLNDDAAFSYYNRVDDEGENIVTQEMLWRDLLEDPTVKRRGTKNKNTYKTLDNRDALPFVVQLVTPDPYTPKAQHAKELKKNTERQKNSINSKKKKGDLTMGTMRGNSRRKDATNIAASIYTLQNDGSRQRVLGEFHLDKSTSSGDLLQVGDQEFQVQSARCQYKYAGGKRFVMVRKILEVKEVTRVAQEESLHKQFQDTRTEEPPPDLE